MISCFPPFWLKKHYFRGHQHDSSELARLIYDLKIWKEYNCFFHAFSAFKKLKGNIIKNKDPPLWISIFFNLIYGIFLKYRISFLTNQILVMIKNCVGPNKNICLMLFLHFKKKYWKLQNLVIRYFESPFWRN